MDEGKDREVIPFPVDRIAKKVPVSPVESQNGGADGSNILSFTAHTVKEDASSGSGIPQITEQKYANPWVDTTNPKKPLYVGLFIPSIDELYNERTIMLSDISLHESLFRANNMKPDEVPGLQYQLFLARKEFLREQLRLGKLTFLELKNEYRRLAVYTWKIGMNLNIDYLQTAAQSLLNPFYSPEETKELLERENNS